MKIENMKVGPRTMVTSDGRPVLVNLVARKATTAPSRLKAALVIVTQDGDGEQHAVPMPYAQATIGVGGEPRGFTPEFRLEMN